MTTTYRKAREDRTLTADVEMFGWEHMPSAGVVTLTTEYRDGSRQLVVLSLEELEDIMRAARAAQRKAVA